MGVKSETYRLCCVPKVTSHFSFSSNLHPRVLERGKKVRMGSGETCIFHFTLLMFLIFMELGFF